MSLTPSEIEQLKIDDKRFIWYPFTQMQQYTEEKSVIIASGEGCTLTDVDGKRYIDGVSSLWTNVHGHRKEALDKALKAQVDQVAHSTLLGLSNVPAIQCAKKLVEITPEGLDRVFYSDSGATSVEIALKVAYQYHYQADEKGSKKRKFVSLKNAYHGDTIGSISVGGIDLFHEKYGALLFECFKAESPYCYRCPLEKTPESCQLACLSSVETILQRHGEEIAALIIEPLVQGAAGIIVHPKGYLKGVRDLCDRYNVLLIADEVAVGFGKTGTLFACEQEGVVPDILTLAKGISGGYLPLAATLTSEKIYRGFLGKYEEFKTFFHGHTYTGNPLACAVAVANLELFETEQVVENLQPKIALLKERLQRFWQLKHVGDIRQCGIMVGIELVADKTTKECFPSANRTGHRVILKAREKGLLIRPLGDVIVLMPPLGISLEELDRLCQITFDSILEVTEQS